MESVVYTKEKAIRAISDKSIFIKSIYFPYYFGFNEAENKFHTFVRFPIIADDVVFSGDERAKPTQENQPMEFREKVWVESERKFGFQKFKGKINKKFFTTYHKTFDVALETSEPVLVDVYDKVEKRDVLNEATNLVIPFKAAKIRAMLESLELDKGIELNAKGKMPYDYEDGIRHLVVGKFVRIVVKGEKLGTTYLYKEGKEFEISEDAKKAAGVGAEKANSLGNKAKKTVAEEFEALPF